MTQWIIGEGPWGDVVISSRIRLARNINGIPFPGRIDEHGAAGVIKTVKDAIGKNPVLSKDFNVVLMKDISTLEAMVLVEEHLISPGLLQRRDQAAAFIKKDGMISIMVNEEDHIRIQVLMPGQQLEKAWDLSNKIDDILEESIDYAFDEKLGYLTACPTNTGTGMRASVMMHLPALALTDQLKRVLQAVGQIGLAVRGVYGEGTDIIGNMLQVSNQLTLGQTEEHIIENLKSVTGEIINKEKKARESILEKNRFALEDKIFRSYGVLKESRILSSKEFMELLSDVRLGVDMGIITGVKREVLNELMLVSQPASLQKKANAQLSDADRDIFRARLVRERLK
jgi:protein arginine kinase